jgi:hypothetical protein
MKNKFVKVNKELKAALMCERTQNKHQSDFTAMFHLQFDVYSLVTITVSTVQSNIWERRVSAITYLNRGGSRVHVL